MRAIMQLGGGDNPPGHCLEADVRDSQADKPTAGAQPVAHCILL